MQENRLQTVIEFGCGDGHQLSLANYPTYVGVDISETVLRKVRDDFIHDKTKRFFALGAPDMPRETFDVALSLDVIYHLVENGVYDDYMRRLFRSSHHSVVIYASASDEVSPAEHVRHRNFPNWIRKHCPKWGLFEHRTNPFPHDPSMPDETSFSSFFFYKIKTGDPSSATNPHSGQSDP